MARYHPFKTLECPQEIKRPVESTPEVTESLHMPGSSQSNGRKHGGMKLGHALEESRYNFNVFGNGGNDSQIVIDTAKDDDDDGWKNDPVSARNWPLREKRTAVAIAMLRALPIGFDLRFCFITSMVDDDNGPTKHDKFEEGETYAPILRYRKALASGDTEEITKRRAILAQGSKMKQIVWQGK
ncbi:hypothetical protein H0H92_002156 [Tricholoma furcatifolium]|nr:hypothetical protein H0H92_002156 [Tricholoma furcatifolium]